MLVSVARSFSSFIPLLSHYNPVAWKTLLICSTVLGDVILSLRTKIANILVRRQILMEPEKTHKSKIKKKLTVVLTPDSYHTGPLPTLCSPTLYE